MDPWTYAPAPESAALANLRPTYRPFVDGEFVDGCGAPLATTNPATEEVLGPPCRVLGEQSPPPPCRRYACLTLYERLYV